MKKVSAIICAFNEEKTLENVIRTASECALINEMIVVNDGSVDQTRNIIDRLKLTLEIKAILLQKNRGKGSLKICILRMSMNYYEKCGCCIAIRNRNSSYKQVFDYIQQTGTASQDDTRIKNGCAYEFG